MEFAASVTALTSLALEVAKTLHKYSSDVRSSSQDIENLLSEVDALSKVLKQLELFLQEDEKGREFDQTVSVLGSTVKACRDTLCDLQSRLQSILGRKFVKLTWPFHKEQLQNLAESLRRYNQVFQFSLTIEGW
jgi:DNA topoisomerase VI subunit B